MTVAIDHVPVRTNPKLRESRLFPSMWTYIRRNGVSIFRIYALYEPLRVFMTAALIVGFAALAVWARFLYFWVTGDGAGHVQSLILGAVLFNAAMRARRARRARRPDRRPADHAAADLRARAARSSSSSACRRRTTSPGTPETGQRADDRRARRRARQDRGARGGQAVSATVTRDAEGTVTGNTYDKYGSTNPVVRRLMATFQRIARRAVRAGRPRRRCSTSAAARRSSRTSGRPRGRRRASSASTSRTRRSSATGSSARRRTSSTGSCGAQEPFPFADGEFALATAIEVLEHVPDPEHAVAEMARCARGGHMLVSVPREPLWRGAQHGTRRLPEAPRQHARPRQPLVARAASRRCSRATGGRRDALAVPVDDAPASRV